MIDSEALERELRQHDIHKLADALPGIIQKGFDPKRFGDLPKWQAAIDSLPDVTPSHVSLNTPTIELGTSEDITEAQGQALLAGLKGLHPWRKGPFDFFGTHIDTEWRSDWKWLRLEKHLLPLEGKAVLDVGCGSGYHCLRMLGEGAKLVLGIDPSVLFLAQFASIKKYTGPLPAHLLPMGIQDLPSDLKAFDTVFSMGVLYHRRSPLEHLTELFQALKPGGQLVLETLVIPGQENECLVPKDRYAQMRNVWFIPTCKTLEGWLARMGFEDVQTVDINVTSTEEQRATEWMQWHSLKDYLHPEDPTRTLEGYPAPTRGLLVAKRPL